MFDAAAGLFQFLQYRLVRSVPDCRQNIADDHAPVPFNSKPSAKINPPPSSVCPAASTSTESMSSVPHVIQCVEQQLEGP